MTVLTRFAALLHIDRRRDGGEADFKAAMKETLPGLVDRWQRLLEELVQDGLLVPAGLNYTFAHLSFQEFLAAKDLFDPNEKRASYAFEQFLSGDDWWKEVSVFYTALSGKPKHVERFITATADRLLQRTGDSSIKTRVHFLFEQMTLAFPGCAPKFP